MRTSLRRIAKFALIAGLLVPFLGCGNSKGTIAANFEKLTPGILDQLVKELLGEPTKRTTADALMIDMLSADVITNCSIKSGSGFPDHFGGGQGADSWKYGPYPGKRDGKPTRSGTLLIGLDFADGKLVSAIKLYVE